MINERLTRRAFVVGGTAAAAAGSCWSTSAAGPGEGCTLENDYLRLVLGPDGSTLAFVDKTSGENYLGATAGPVFSVIQGGARVRVSRITFADGMITASFGDSGTTAILKPVVHPRHLVLEVVSIAPEPEEFVLADIPLAVKGTSDEPFAACALALNLHTKVEAIPGPVSHLGARCYGRFGCAGAKVALVGCRVEEFRRVLQEAVAAAAELPHSPIGGPWALGKPINQGSYLFNFGGMSLDNVDEWIEVAKTLGFNQIDFHGGHSFRFGDCRPDPKTYPDGMASFKKVIDRLHAAGIQAGLHTYAFFIHKACPWVTPVPDPRLAKDAVFTLAGPLDETAAAVPVDEPTETMSTTTGFFVRNSVTLQIDDELITYAGIGKEPPDAFTGCARGACGTKAAAHQKGARVHHLKECFGLFVPDPRTTLLAEVAAKTAEMFNTCGFDMIYLDALDGEDILGGGENGWHYGSRFVFEIQKRLERPALFEMSTFHHHLWYVRSRLGAWDHPTRSHKKFIDIHAKAVDGYRRMFMPGHLGWWALKTYGGAQTEPTFADDIEYLVCKCLGMDVGLSMMGIDPSSIRNTPVLPRLAGIIKRYEDLRHSGQVPEAVKEKLRSPGEEFALAGSLEAGWRFLPVDYARHKVVAADSAGAAWRVTNRFDSRPVQLRIEALLAAAPYDSPEAVTLAEFAAADEFAKHGAAPGVTAGLVPSDAQVKVGATSGCLTASHGSAARTNTWAYFEKTFDPPLNLGGREALGVWIYGDGLGEVLNFRVQSPSHVSHADGERYVVIDFTGWRYCELIEPEGERHEDYVWPYGGIYSTYRECVDFGRIGSVSVWCNDLAPGKTATCYLGPLKAIPVVETTLAQPCVTIGGKSITFPVEIKSGEYLEYAGPGDCKLYGRKGELLAEIPTEEPAPILPAGEQEVRFACRTPQGLSARANVTVITRGPAL